jgi:cation transporter-like permease
MQGLKILVIAMGVLILIGVTVVVVTVASKLKGGSAGRSFGAASLVLPKGCRVVEMATAGARLALRLGEGPDCQLILLVDPESGRETGRVSLLAQP